MSKFANATTRIQSGLNTYARMLTCYLNTASAEAHMTLSWSKDSLLTISNLPGALLEKVALSGFLCRLHGSVQDRENGPEGRTQRKFGAKGLEPRHHQMGLGGMWLEPLCRPLFTFGNSAVNKPAAHSPRLLAQRSHLVPLRSSINLP
jgi:hypothetical protein